MPRWNGHGPFMYELGSWLRPVRQDVNDGASNMLPALDLYDRPIS